MMNSRLEKIGLLGKLPSHGDFIRINVQGNVWKSFDAWIQEGFHYASEMNAFEEGYVGSDGYAFYFSAPGTGQALIGYLHPSQDSIGRKFPVIIAALIDAGNEIGDWHNNPVILHHAFVQKARYLVERVMGQGYDRHLLSEEVGELLHNVHLDEATLMDHSPEKLMWKDLSERCGFLFEDPQKFLPFKNLVEIVYPLRSGVPTHYTLGFRFPGSNAVKLQMYAASFWLAAFRKAVGQPAPEQCVFWRTGEARSSLSVFLQPPPAKVIVNMLPAESESDYICDMDQIGLRKKDTAAESLPETLRQALDSPDANLAQILHLLS